MIAEGRRCLKMTRGGVNYAAWIIADAPGFWWWWFTPRWHAGRGPYISIGLGIIAIGRGY